MIRSTYLKKIHFQQYKVVVIFQMRWGQLFKLHILQLQLQITPRLSLIVLALWLELSFYNWYWWVKRGKPGFWISTVLIRTGRGIILNLWYGTMRVQSFGWLVNKVTVWVKIPVNTRTVRIESGTFTNNTWIGSHFSRWQFPFLRLIWLESSFGTSETRESEIRLFRIPKWLPLPRDIP